MKKEHRRIWVYVLTVFTVIFMSVSLIVITVYKSALNEELYKQAFSQSQIYTIVADIIERNISDALVVWEKDMVENLTQRTGLQDNKIANGALTFVLNTVIEQQTPNLVSDIFTKIGLAEIFQNIIEKKIEKDIAWIDGDREAKQIFEYIPTPEQIESIQGSSFTQLLDAVTKNALGFNDLQPCASDSEVSINIARIAAGNSKEVTCINEQINALLVQQFDNSKVKTVVERVGGGADELAQNSRIDALLTDVYDLSLALAKVKQAALDLRSAIQSIKQFAVVLFWFSIISGIVAIVLQERGRQVKLFITIFFTTGIIMTIFALLYYVIFSKIAINALPFNSVNFGSKALSAAEGAMLMESIKFMIDYIIKGLVLSTFYVGVWMTTISVILYGALAVFKRRQKILDRWL